jgi:hypothetical protein
MRSGLRAPILITMKMDAPDATFTNGRYELPRSARGVLVLADPPEAGWRLQPPANEPATAECKPLSAAVSANPIAPTE